MRWRWLLVALVGCGSVVAGPFVPAAPTRCGADPDCPEHYHCAFPAVDTSAVCMPGESDINVWEQQQ